MSTKQMKNSAVVCSPMYVYLYGKILIFSNLGGM